MAKRHSEDSITPIVSTEVAAEPAPAITPSTSDEASAMGLPDLLLQFTRPVITEEQIQSATTAFESRLNELTQLLHEFSDLASAARRFKAAPESFGKAALLIHDTLDRTLRSSPMDLWPNGASRTKLIQLCADCLHAAKKVLTVLDLIQALRPFQSASEELYLILELERIGNHDEVQYLEDGIWEDCLPGFLQEIEVITSRLQMSIEPSDGKAPSKGVENVTWKGATFQIDHSRKTLARIDHSFIHNTKISFKRQHTPHQWNVAVAFLKSQGTSVDVSKIVRKDDAVYCRDLVRKVRGEMEELGVSLLRVNGQPRSWRMCMKEA